MPLRKPLTYDQWQEIAKASISASILRNPGDDHGDIIRTVNERMVEVYGPCPPKPEEPPGPPFWMRLGARAIGGGDMVKTLKGIWTWLNGKKTLISSLVVGLPLIWNEVAPILGAAGVEEPTILYIGGLIGFVVGWGHKLGKALGWWTKPEDLRRGDYVTPPR